MDSRVVERPEATTFPGASTAERLHVDGLHGFARRQRLVDLAHDVARVRADAREATRAPGVEPGQADEIQPRDTRDAAALVGTAALVEHRYFHPAVVGAKADAPNDGGDAELVAI